VVGVGYLTRERSVSRNKEFNNNTIGVA